MNDSSDPPKDAALAADMARAAGLALSSPAQHGGSGPPPLATAHERLPLHVIRSCAPVRLDDFAELWASRELLGILAWRDVSVRYKQTVLGVLWALLQPALQTAIFTVLFNRMAGIHATGGLPFVPFVLSGIAIWGLFSGGLTQAADSLVRNSNLVSKVYFPRVIIPLSALFVSIIDFAFSALLLIVVMFYYHIVPGIQVLWVAPLALQAVIMAAGAGLFLAALNVEYRDVKHVLPFFVQIMMYVTPVFYPTSMVPAALRPLFELNPLVALLDGFRAALFDQPMPFGRLAVSLALSLVLLVFGYLYFRRFERTMSDRI